MAPSHEYTAHSSKGVPVRRPAACCLALLPAVVFGQSAPNELPTTLSGGGPGSGAMFDLTGLAADVRVLRLGTLVDLPAFAPYTFAIWTREGSFVGHTSSPDGWLLH